MLQHFGANSNTLVAFASVNVDFVLLVAFDTSASLQHLVERQSLNSTNKDKKGINS